MIYAIQAGNDGPVGPIKFGYSRDIEGRLATFQTASAETLFLIAYCAVAKETEASIHHFLREDRLSGEWFKPTPKVMGMIAAMHRQAAAGPFEFSITNHIYEHGFDTVVWYRSNNLGFEVFDDEIERAAAVGLKPTRIAKRPPDLCPECQAKQA